ncbi:MAG: hypothetical protein QNJ98_10690 [Planctomycetota bacterium]|nr:hypothetical protein [Planctomycetota bacterium]
MKSLATRLALILALLGVSGLAYGDETAGSPAMKPSVRLARIAIRGPLPKLKGERLSWNGGKHGTELTLLVVNPTGGLFQLQQSSSLDALTDDRGTDLVGSRQRHDRPVGRMQATSDGRYMLVRLKGKLRPARGSKAVHAKGRLVFKRATKSSKVETASIAVKAGTTFELAGRTYTIQHVTPQKGREAIAITLASKQGFDAIKSLRILGADGKAIEHSGGFSGRFGSSGSRMSTEVLFLEAKPDTIRIAAEVWSDLHDIEVPFDLNAGLGL